jgi:hypothetical protein
MDEKTDEILSFCLDNGDLLPFRKVRYWMFRLANEAQGGATADAPLSIIEHYSEMDSFKLAGEWKQFGVRWDISESYEIIALDESLLNTWNDFCKSVAKDLPIVEQPEREIKDKKALRHLVYDVEIGKGGKVTVKETELTPDA